MAMDADALDSFIHDAPQSEVRKDMARAFGFDAGECPRFMHDPFGRKGKDFQRENLKVCGPRLLMAWVWYLSCVYANNFSQAWLQDNMAGFYESEWQLSPANFSASQEWLKEHDPRIFQVRWGNSTPRANAPEATEKYYQNRTVILWDFTYLYLPPVHGSGPANFFVGVSSAVVMVRFVILPGPLSMRWVFLKRVFVVWGIVFLLRAFTIFLTPLPNPFDACIPEMAFQHNPWAAAAANMPGMNSFYGVQNTCQDVLFSGHTAAGTTFTLFFMGYIGKAPWFQTTTEGHCLRLTVKVLAWCWLLFGWYVIVASHFHYTVDVLVGAIITFNVYGFYHTRIKTVSVSSRWGLVPISSFLRWFEKDSPDIMFWDYQVKRRMTTSGPGDPLLP